jgi:hypothetical protein
VINVRETFKASLTWKPLKELKILRGLFFDKLISLSGISSSGLV